VLDVVAVQAAVLDWYADNGRDLPWRRTRDPYAILVAEVMLQQTQVDRVIPKWYAWLNQFPTLRHLARASRADAIRAWQGLGYNTRAVRLHAIACQAMVEFEGRLPSSIEQLMRLKGVGRYTAGAVACFAYEQPVAIVDTNIRRVLSRVFSIDPAHVGRVADEVVPRSNAYAWNQALMDLGATLCRGNRPLCLVCPLVRHCGGPGRPVKRPRPEPFKGSTRFLRGRVLELLIDAGDIPLQDLSDVVEGRTDVIDALSKDGLVVIDGNLVRLAD
jgi:A/G-specific adenine glycosylase